MELKYNGRTFTESELTALEREAYRSVPVPTWLRATYVLLTLALGATVFLSIARAQAMHGKLVPYGLIPALGILATLFCAWEAWSQRTRKTYAVVAQPEDLRVRRKHAIGSTLAFTACLGFIWGMQYMQSDFNEYWWTVWPLLPLWFIYLIYSLVFLETRPKTEAAKVIAARHTVQGQPLLGWQVALLRFLGQMPVRYAIGFVLFYACYDNFNEIGSKHFGWKAVAMLLIPAIMATYELALPLLGLALTLGIVLVVLDLLSLLPLSVAIIIAAVIIAQSLQRLRKSRKELNDK